METNKKEEANKESEQQERKRPQKELQKGEDSSGSKKEEANTHGEKL